MEIKDTIMKIKDIIEGFIEYFHLFCSSNRETVDIQNLTEENISKILSKFFACKKFTDAQDILYNSIDEYVDGRNEKIDWSLDNPRETPEFIRWYNNSNIHSIFSNVADACRLYDHWVEINGHTHTPEDAATIAAMKWMELLFDWHLQDNGALNEEHSFNMCALGTILADRAKKDITDDMKLKAYKLFYEYYLRSIHFKLTSDHKDIDWLNENLPDRNPQGKKYEWDAYGLKGNVMYSDYGPGYSLYLILENAGIPENDIRDICPWKTGIYIRVPDNAVMYQTYGRIDEI